MALRQTYIWAKIFLRDVAYFTRVPPSEKDRFARETLTVKRAGIAAARGPQDPGARPFRGLG